MRSSDRISKVPLVEYWALARKAFLNCTLLKSPWVTTSLLTLVRRYSLNLRDPSILGS